MLTSVTLMVFPVPLVVAPQLEPEEAVQDQVTFVTVAGIVSLKLTMPESLTPALPTTMV